MIPISPSLVKVVDQFHNCETVRGYNSNGNHEKASLAEMCVNNETIVIWLFRYSPFWIGILVIIIWAKVIKSIN